MCRANRQLRVKPGAAKAKAGKPSVFAIDDTVAARPTGLDGRTSERLHRGALEPDARIDLHGMTETVAHRALATFIRGASMRGCRLVLIVTGKGLKPADPHEPFDLELVRRTARCVALDDAALAGRTRSRGLCGRYPPGPSPSWRRRRALCLSAQERTAMKQHFGGIEIETRGPGLYDVTAQTRGFVRASAITDGLLTCLMQHTSASLLIQENADPDVLADLESFMQPSGLARSKPLSPHHRRAGRYAGAYPRGADRGVALDSRARRLRRCLGPGRDCICSSIATARTSARSRCISSANNQIRFASAASAFEAYSGRAP